MLNSVPQQGGKTKPSLTCRNKALGSRRSNLQGKTSLLRVFSCKKSSGPPSPLHKKRYNKFVFLSRIIKSISPQNILNGRVIHGRSSA